MHNKFLMGVKFWTSWGVAPTIFQNHTLENIFQKLSPRGYFWKFSKISPTSPKFNTHKKIVVHFFIPMLLLPLTPSLIYLKLKRFKGPKTHHFFFFTSLSQWKNLKNQKWIHICNAKCYAECYAIYLTKKVLKENTARARLAWVWIQLQFFKEIPLKISSIQFFSQGNLL